MAVQSKAIKSRIKSVRNTKKITKAMELVSASKMRRVVSKTLSTRPYIQESLNIVHAITNPQTAHPLLTVQKADKTLVVVITSNKGLCGGYNAQLLRAVSLFSAESVQGCEYVTVGKKGDMALRLAGAPITASFEQKSPVSLQEASAIGDYVVAEFLKGTYSRVMVAYTEYISALTQQPHVKQLIPFIDENTKDHILKEEYVFEPDPDSILDVVIDKIIHTRLYGMLLESASSEESSRMLAMKNASESANEMMRDLSVTYNKIRQASITQEISEISAGMTSAQ